MLKQMRSGAQSTFIKFILFSLLVMAMAGLAFMDVQGVMKGGLSSTTVAKYKDGKIKVPEFTRLVQNVMKRQRLSEKEAAKQNLPLQILQGEVSDRLFRLAAHNTGLKIGNNIVAKQVQQIISPLVEQGATPEEALARVLSNANMSEQQFIYTLKSYVSSQQLLSAISSGVTAPKALTETILKHRNETRTGKYFTLSASDIKDEKAPSDEKLKEYYMPIAAEYAIPEYRDLSIAILGSKAVEKDITVSDEQIKEAYEENLSSFITPEVRKISQAVAKDEKTAKDIFASASKDKKLAKITKEKEELYLQPTNFTLSDLPKELSEVAFNAKEGDVLGPIQSPLGWHVLYIEDILSTTTQTLKQASKEIKKELKRNLIEEAIYKIATQIDDDIAGGKNISEIAKDYNLKINSITNVNKKSLNSKGKNPIKELPIYEQILEMAFELEENVLSQMLETEDNKFIIVNTDKIFSARIQPLEDVKDKVLKRWVTNKKTAALSDKALEILEEIETNSNFNALAKRLGKEIVTTKPIKRNNKKTNIYIVNALFNLTKHHDITSISSNKAVTILKLDSIEYKKSDKPDVAQFKSIEKELTKNLQQDILQQFRTNLMNKYDVTINEDLISKLYSDNGENGEL